MMQHHIPPKPTSEHLFKVLVIGEASTGKTSFIKRNVHQFFSRAYKATIGVDFALKTIQFDDNTLVRLQLWDIAGQERFGSMTKVYYKDAVGAFVVFDVHSPKTFEAVMRWKKDLDSKVSLSDGSNIPCLLLANKCDLVDRSETTDELNTFAKQIGFIGCLYTSPKENINIESAVRILAQEIMRRQQGLNDELDYNRHDTIKLTDQANRRTRLDMNGQNKNCCA